MKQVGVALIALALVFSIGCMEVNSVVYVKKDGSGTVTEAVFFNEAMMNMMMMQMGGSQTDSSDMSIPINEEEYRAKAKKMGATYKSAKEINAGGKRGLRVTYQFADITTLKIDQNPSMPGEGMAGPKADTGPDTSVTFGFKKGANPKLTINLPQPDYAAAEKAKADMPETPEMPEMDAQQKAMMKQMFDGFVVRMMVKVEGEIKESNATYQSKTKSAKGNNIITLMDMDIGKLVADDEQFAKLQAMGEADSIVEAKKMLKDMPGLKVETEKKIEVSFE